jgi:hypothetical protein
MVMGLESVLRGLKANVLVEAVYLTGRILSHRLSQKVFLKQVADEVKAPERKAVKDAVQAILSEIEREQRQPIKELAPGARSKYVKVLDSMSRRLLRTETPQTEVKKALNSLRSIAQ